MKLCPRCKITKPEDQFTKKGSGRVGPYCKPCKREYDHEYWQRTKAWRNERKQFNAEKIRERNSRFLAEYLEAHPCVDCGEPDIVVLDFDHEEKKHKDITTMARYCASIENLRKEIAKCSIRCANCHRRKTAKEQNSWRYKRTRRVG